jgi:hypothetical protein
MHMSLLALADRCSWLTDVIGVSADAVAAGGAHTCALRSDGHVVCWGNNDNGQLGIGSTLRVGAEAGQMGSSLTPVDLGTGVISNDTICAWEIADFAEIKRGVDARSLRQHMRR